VCVKKGERAGGRFEIVLHVGLTDEVGGVVDFFHEVCEVLGGFGKELSAAVELQDLHCPAADVEKWLDFFAVLGLHVELLRSQSKRTFRQCE
jgi:hypothetical protein